MLQEKHIGFLFAIGTIGLIIAIIAAVTSTPTITGRAIGTGDPIPDAYARPLDPYNGNNPLISLTATPGAGNQFTADVGVHSSAPGGYIYQYGYYLSGDTWTRFTFNNANNGWVAESASHAISDAYNNHVLTPNNEEFVVAIYSCKSYNNDWQCGCKAQGDCGYWMLQSVNLGDGYTSGEYMTVSPREQTATRNGVFPVTVQLAGGSSVYGFDIDVAYDASVLDFVSLSYGDYLGTNGYPGNTTAPADFLCVDYDASTDGLVSNIACTHIGTDLSNGAGDLVTLNFRAANQAGYTQIMVSSSEVAEWPDVATDGTTPTITSWNINNAYVVIE